MKEIVLIIIILCSLTGYSQNELIEIDLNTKMIDSLLGISLVNLDDSVNALYISTDLKIYQYEKAYLELNKRKFDVISIKGTNILNSFKKFSNKKIDCLFIETSTDSTIMVYQGCVNWNYETGDVEIHMFQNQQIKVYKWDERHQLREHKVLLTPTKNKKS